MKKRKYCVTANIKRKHKGLGNIINLDIWTFPCGKPVYICNSPLRDPTSVLVMGLCRLRFKYVFDIVPIVSLENIQSGYVNDPHIVKLMDSHELRHLWWGDKPEDEKAAERYAEVLRQRQQKILDL